MAVKQSNEALVLFTLAIAETPLTINQIVTRSNKSYNTVKSVVLADERIAKVTEYPARYHLGKPEVLDEHVIRLKDEKPKEGWVKWLSKVAPKFPDFVRIEKTRKSEELRKQGMVLEALGTNLLIFGRELQDKSDEPHWFALIGGSEE